MPRVSSPGLQPDPFQGWACEPVPSLTRCPERPLYQHLVLELLQEPSCWKSS